MSDGTPWPGPPYLGGHLVVDEVPEQPRVVERQDVLYHGENVDRGVREILKPVLAPIGYEEKKMGSLSLPFHITTVLCNA